MPELFVGINPCLRCGACCSRYRVSFYWGEADDAPGGTVPVDLTEEVTSFRRCMRGTNSSRPRCVALEGEVGQEVTCAIYAQRPSPCREFGVQWQAGVLSYADEESLARCTAVRAAFGLPPVTGTPVRTYGVRQEAS